MTFNMNKCCYEILGTGSSGNAVIYWNTVLVDCGVPFKVLKNHVKNIDFILLTHQHGDHINLTTLEKIRDIRPAIKIVCPEYLYYMVLHLGYISVVKTGVWYKMGSYFKFSPVFLEHDVKNCGYKMFFNYSHFTHKIFHATDCAHLNGIDAYSYDLYAIEHNHSEDEIMRLIDEKKTNGEYSYEERSLNNHLSEEKAQEFIFKNRKSDSQVLRLHESNNTL